MIQETFFTLMQHAPVEFYRHEKGIELAKTMRKNINSATRTGYLSRKLGTVCTTLETRSISTRGRCTGLAD